MLGSVIGMGKLKIEEDERCRQCLGKVMDVLKESMLEAQRLRRELDEYRAKVEK